MDLGLLTNTAPDSSNIWKLGDNLPKPNPLPAERLMIVVDFGVYLSGHEPNQPLPNHPKPEDKDDCLVFLTVNCLFPVSNLPATRTR